MRRALAIVLVLQLAPAQRADACAAPRLVDVPMTRDGTTLLEGGGVVIRTVNGGNHTADQDDDGSVFAGTTDVTLRVDWVAPGLSVIVPKPRRGRVLTLGARTTKPALKLRQGGVAPKHAAPNLVAVSSSLSRADAASIQASRMYGAPGAFVVELAEAPPADVLALVVYQGGAGIAWAAPSKQLSYTFRFGGKNCSPGPAALVQGSKVTVGWLDESGRVSLLTKEIQVSAIPVATPRRP
ncbi:hypothetical protein BH11MYX3_BH11MYX3_08700 [soil metagenome]